MKTSLLTITLLAFPFLGASAMDCELSDYEKNQVPSLAQKSMQQMKELKASIENKSVDEKEYCGKLADYNEQASSVSKDLHKTMFHLGEKYELCVGHLVLDGKNADAYAAAKDNIVKLRRDAHEAESLVKKFQCETKFPEKFKSKKVDTKVCKKMDEHIEKIYASSDKEAKALELMKELQAHKSDKPSEKLCNMVREAEKLHGESRDANQASLDALYMMTESKDKKIKEEAKKCDADELKNSMVYSFNAFTAADTVEESLTELSSTLCVGRATAAADQVNCLKDTDTDPGKGIKSNAKTILDATSKLKKKK